MTQAADNIPKTNAVDAARLIVEHGAALGPNGIAVSLHLLALADESGRVEQTPQQIADAIGSSRMTVIRTLARLEQMRHVTKAKAIGATYTSVWQLSAAYINLVYTKMAYTNGIQASPETGAAYTNGIQVDDGTGVATRAGGSASCLKKKSKRDTSKVVGSGKGKKTDARASAPSAPDRTPEDEKREEFFVWLESQSAEYREALEYAAPAMGAPIATTSSRKRAEAASVVRMILADGADLELFKAVRRAYTTDPWRDRATGKAIPLTPAILRERWAELRARVEGTPDEAGDDGAAPVPAGTVVEFDQHLTHAQRLAREKQARVNQALAEARAREGRTNGQAN
jgi:hypothetical protein